MIIGRFLAIQLCRKRKATTPRERRDRRLVDVALQVWTETHLLCPKIEAEKKRKKIEMVNEDEDKTMASRATR